MYLGKILVNFSKLQRNYSYPSINNSNDVDKSSYVVIIESTHSLKSQLVKKAEQLRNYFYFFSSLENYISEHNKYFGSFYDNFVIPFFNTKKFIINYDLKSIPIK